MTVGAVTSIVPPLPVAPVPLARIMAELNNRSPACTLTVPPCSALLASSTAEVVCTTAFPACTVIEPAVPAVPVAWIGALFSTVPAALITTDAPATGAACSTDCPWISTRPPGAWSPAACSNTLPPWPSSSRP